MTTVDHLVASPALEVTTDAARWAEAARASGQPLHPFAGYGWLELAAQLTGTSFVPIVVRDGAGDVGVVPWLERRRGPLKTVNALPFPYAGPLVPAELLAGTVRALRQRSRRERVVREEFGLAPTTAYSAPDLTAAGHTVRVDETYLVDTGQSLETLTGQLSQACRKSLRKAERDGVVVDTRHDGGTLGRVVAAAHGARGISSGYADTFPSPAELAGRGFDLHWTVARQPDGTEMGSLLTVADGGTAFLWLGGVLPEHRTSRANVLLYWDAIRWAHEQGIRTVDMVGVPDPGIGRFKSQFGGTLHPYVRLQRTAPALAGAQAVLGRLRALRSGAED